MGLHRKESRSFNGFGKILTKTIKITKTEIETKEKPQILHFQVKNTGFCQQSEKQALPVFFVYAFKSDGSRKTSRAVSAIAFAAV